jgi:hypothetical protein
MDPLSDRAPQGTQPPVVQGLGTDLFTERLRRFEQNENPEGVLLVADDPEFTKIVVAWTDLGVRPVEEPTRPPGEPDRDIWDWLWHMTLCSHRVRLSAKPAA